MSLRQYLQAAGTKLGRNDWGHAHGAPSRVAERGVHSLCDLAGGESGNVVGLEGGHGFIGRMVALGFTPGANVDVVRNDGHGPLIVRVLDTQIALGRGQACQVIVRKL